MAHSTVDRKKHDHELISRAQKGDVAARSPLVTRHIRLVHKLAKKFQRRSNIMYEDLVQEGICGLLSAVDRFDLSRDVQFSTYAVPWIRSCIIEAIMQGLGKDKSSQKVYWHSAKAATELWQETGTQPSREDLAERLDVKPRYVANVHAVTMPTIEYVDDWSEDTTQNFDNIETELLKEATAREVRRALGKLTCRERQILKQRHMSEDKGTLQEAGEAVGLSRERARQIEVKALEKLRIELQKGKQL